MDVSRRRFLAAFLGVIVALTACSGGGGSGGGGGEDATEGALTNGERLVSFRGAGGLNLAGTLGVPEQATGPAPGVLILSSLASNVDHDGFQTATDPDKLYLDLSKALNAAGMVTLRYDRRGVGASKLESGSKLPTYDQLVGDARGALIYLAQRREVGSAGVAVLGHDVGGWMAMQLAATDTKVKAVTLLSTPGRPLVDVLADGFKATYGAASADRFRATVAGFLASGKLPGPDAIAPEHQGVLAQGYGDILKGEFSASPVADAGKVKVPTQVIYGMQATTVTKVDADILAKAIGPTAQVVPYEGGTNLKPVLPDGKPPVFDPLDESTHVFGARPIVSVDRDAATLAKISSFLLSSARGAKG